MASIERLVKSLDALKVLQTPIEKPEEPLISAKFMSKKEQASISKKEKIAHLNNIADCICSPQLRNYEDFPKFLGITIETFLACCDDGDVDTRNSAGECLNRTVKCNYHTNFNRIQLEFYKELRKNGSSRSVRAALSRFAELAHLFKPLKCRPYFVQLIPVIEAISTRTSEESIQETISTAMKKLMPVFGRFATKDEIVQLLKCFLPNIGYSLAAVRRTASISLAAICKHSKTPTYFYSWLIQTLLKTFQQTNQPTKILNNSATQLQESTNNFLSGLFLTLKHIFPLLADCPTNEESQSLVISQKQKQIFEKMIDNLKDNLLQMYALIFHSLRYSNDNTVVLSALEALQQLKYPPKIVLSNLLSINGLNGSSILSDQSYLTSVPSSPSLSQKRVKGYLSIASSCDNVDALEDDEEIIIESFPKATKLSSENRSTIDLSLSSRSEIFDGTRVNSSLSIASDPDSVCDEGLGKDLEEKSPLKYSGKLIPMVIDTFNDESSIATDAPLSPAPSTPSYFDIEMMPQVNGIGDICAEDTLPLEYCTRLLCARFLLGGTKGSLIPDKLVRVSIKSLALSCVTHIIPLYPKALLLDLYVNKSTIDSQKIWDIILYSSHPDPHLKSQISLVISNFLKHVLELPALYSSFISNNCAPADIPDAPSLEKLVNHIFSILIEPNSTSSSIRNALQSLQICLPSIIKSQENVISLLPKILNRFKPLKDHNYWLVKAGLLELLSSLPYNDLAYLEKNHLFQIDVSLSSNLNNFFVDEIFLPLLSDTDFRVRASASSSIVRLVRNIFIAGVHNNGDPVIESAENFINMYLTSYSSFKVTPSTTSGPFPLHFLSKDFNFIPLFQSKKAPIKSDHFIERNLKYVVDKIICHMKSYSDHRPTLFGCLQALYELSEEYLVTNYPKAWSIQARDNSQITFLLDYLLYITTNYLPLITDLTSHQVAIGLIGNLLSGLAYQVVRQSIEDGSVLNVFEHDWGYISKDAKELESLFSRSAKQVIKLLSIFAVVYDDSNLFPRPSNNYSSSASKGNPNTSPQSFTPRRRKSFKDEIEKGENSKKVPNEREKNKVQKHVSFYHDPIMFKLFEIIKSVYVSSKISMEIHDTKMTLLLQSTLNMASQILEIGGVKYFGQYAQDMLIYLNIILPHQPTQTVACVRQLLKCLFSLNYANLLAKENEEAEINNVGDSTSLDQVMESSSTIISNPSSGFYQTVIATPYSNFFNYCTSYAPSLGPLSQNFEDFQHWQSYFRKAIDKRVNQILQDKSSLLDSQLTQISQKITPAGYIRLFESLVSKSLNLYTSTGDAELQKEILDFVCLLIRLKIDYNLLDPNNVFFEFVKKQVSLIENGYLGRCESLIEYIFNFFLLLSYSRDQFNNSPSSIITVPEIIPLCHDLMASEQPSSFFALPAIKVIAEDLMLYRVPSKIESAKELEAQREVALADLLKLADHPQSIRLFLMPIRQSRLEGEEKWRKISRQIIDVLLPLLTRQGIYICSFQDLEIIHQVCDSVCPAVFRPADFLLRALFTPPDGKFLQDHHIFQRWISSILVILRVLIIHTKEEIVLARLDDLLQSHSITIKWMKEDLLVRSELEEQMEGGLASVSLIAEFLLNIVRICIETLVYYRESSNQILRNQSDVLVQLASSLLLYLTYMFQSGSYRRVAKRTLEFLKEMVSRNSVLGMINSSLSKIDSLYPTLMFQWCNILMILGFDDHGTHRFWYRLIKGIDPIRTDLSPLVEVQERDEEKVDDDFIPKLKSLNVEMVSRAALILMCDFVCENMNDVEHLTWLIVNNIYDIIRWSYELPIRDFIHVVHRNQASSGLFLQAVAARCDNFKEIPFLHRLLRCVELSHETQSGTLIALIVDQILTNPQTRPYLSIRCEGEKIALNKLNILLKLDNPEDAALQLNAEDLEKLINKLGQTHHRALVNSLRTFQQFISPVNQESEHPLLTNEILSNLLKIDVNRSKEWFIQFFSDYCRHAHDCDQIIILFDKLLSEELNTIFLAKNCGLEILVKYLNFLSSDKAKFCLVRSIIDRIEPIPDTIPKARSAAIKLCISITEQHLSKIHSNLPSPHYTFASTCEMFSAREIKHRDQLIELFQQNSFRDYLHLVMPLYTSFLDFSENSKYYDSTPEVTNLLARIYVLYAEMMFYDTECGNFNSINSYVSLLHHGCSSKTFALILDDNRSVTLLCSIIASIHAVVRSMLGEIRSVHLRKIVPERENVTKDQRAEFRHLIRACDRALELMLFLYTSENWSTVKFPSTLLNKLRDLVITLCRAPLINSLMMIPLSVWQLDLWRPEFSGLFGTICSIVPSEYIRDKEILKQLILSVNSLGWIHRIRFEELWMTFLGVISPLQGGDGFADDKLLVATVAINGMTNLILQSLHEQPGNPLKPVISYNPKRQISFMQTKFGEKLTRILKNFELAKSTDDRKKYLMNRSLEKLFSVDYLRKHVGMSNEISLPSSASSSTSSSATQSPHKPLSFSLPFESLSSRDGSQIDIKSCIHFLLELYNQLISTHLTRSPLIIEVSRSLCYVSDLFFERSQYEWYLNVSLELYRLSTVNEDDMNLQYVIYGIAKSAAILCIDQDQQIEKCKKNIENSLKSSFLPTRIYTLRGLFYLLERKNILPGGKEEIFLPPLCDYLVKHLTDSNLPSSHNEEHIIIMWELSFHLVEHFSDCFPDNSFPQKVFQMSTSLLALESKNTKVYAAVSKGLERLLCCEIYLIADAEIIMGIILEKLKHPSLSYIEAFSALRLMVTCIYIYDLSFVSESRSNNPNEGILFAIERVRAIFDRMKNCGKEEAYLIASIIPSILCDFLPTQEVLVKTIGEFLANRHILPQITASIVFKVFTILQQHSETSKIRDWILLSLSSFTQIQPISSATWSLSCFLLSASSNIWIRNLFFCHVGRLGLYEAKDEELFIASCCNFYDELSSDKQRDSFYTALREVAQPGNAYAKVLSNLEPTQNVQ